jgi:uncharacterized protein YndB with AHSA1/START domain
MSEGRVLELDQTIEAPRDVIWKACATADGLARWQADSAEGEAKVGSTLTLHWNAFGASVELDVVALEPRERIVLRSADSEVEFRVRDDGLTLRHRSAEVDEDREGLESSWRVALSGLAHCAERHPGRRRRVSWFVRQAQTSPEAAHAFFTDPHCLNSWLTRSGSIGPEGSDAVLVFKNAPTASGRVLANVTGRDVAVSCREYGDALLSFRTLPAPMPRGAGPERVLAITLSEWGPPREPSRALKTQLDGALAKLARVLASGGSA